MKSGKKLILSILIIIVMFQIVQAQGDGYALTFESEKNDFGCLYFTDWNLDGSSEMTISAWVRWSIVPTAEAGAEDNKWANIISNNAYDTPDDGQFWLQHNSDNSAFEFALKTTNARRFISSTTTPQKDIWYHVTGVYDDNAAVSMKLYINGSKEAEYNSLSGTINPFDERFITKMGRWSDSRYPRHFDGSIDEVTIWSRALSQAEVQTLMTNQLPVDQSGLQGYWKFDDASGDRFSDETGHRDGIIFSTYNGYGRASGGSSTTLEDNSDIWSGRDFSGRPVHIISGSGALQGGMIASNTSTVITLENQWNYYSEDPDNSSYYAISCFSKWNRYVKNTSSTAMGPAGKQIIATITSTPDDDNHLLLYKHGWLPTELDDGETIPAGFSRRAGFCWGVDDIGTVTENVTFDYSSVSGIVDPADIDILRRDDRLDSSWEEVTETSRNDVERTIDINGVSSSGEYVLGSRNSNDFPSAVTLTYFIGSENDEGVCLTWQTESETENLGFIIERREAGNSWEIIAQYNDDPNLRGAWNSSATQIYTYTDGNVKSGETYEYRLSDVGCSSGVAEYDKIVSVTTESRLDSGREPVTLLNATPNPFNPKTAIQFDLDRSMNVSLSIYNLSGECLETLYEGYSQAGRHSIEWNAGGFPSGLYIYKLEAETMQMYGKCLLLK